MEGVLYVVVWAGLAGWKLGLGWCKACLQCQIRTPDHRSLAVGRLHSSCAVAGAEQKIVKALLALVRKLSSMSAQHACPDVQSCGLARVTILDP